MCWSSRPGDASSELAAQHPRPTFWHPHGTSHIRVLRWLRPHRPTAGSVEVLTPPVGSVAPPGHHLRFIVDERDVWALSRSEEHTSELQSRGHLVCSLLLE